MEALVFGKTVITFVPVAGEADDKATNLKLVAPNPTEDDPLLMAANGTANIKFTWDAVDTIIDGDTDMGEWAGAFDVMVDGASKPAELNVYVQVEDPGYVPESSTCATAAAGTLCLLGLARLRRKRVSKAGRIDGHRAV